MKRTLFIAFICAVVATAGIAQETLGGQRPGGTGDGERSEGAGQFGEFNPEMIAEMLAERAQSELEVWHKYLTLTEEQTPVVLEVIEAFYASLFEGIGQGFRPDPEATQELQAEKDYAIYELLTSDQQAIMQYYYEEISAEILATGRIGPGRGQGRPQ